VVLGLDQHVPDVGQDGQEFVARHSRVVHGRLEVFPISGGHVKPVGLGQTRVARNVIRVPYVFAAVRYDRVFLSLKKYPRRNTKKKKKMPPKRSSLAKSTESQLRTLRVREWDSRKIFAKDGKTKNIVCPKALE